MITFPIAVYRLIPHNVMFVEANDHEFRIAYDALEDEFAALAALLDARTSEIIWLLPL